MKRFTKRLIRKIIWWAEDDSDPDYDDSISVGKNNSIFYNSEYREFRIYRADSGHVVEIYSYRKNKESNNTLHIIRSDQDLGNELSKILVMCELNA